MSYSPSVQASMELQGRFTQAVAGRKIPQGTPFQTKIEKEGEKALKMFCVDASGMVIQTTGSVLFWPNITDPMSMA